MDVGGFIRGERSLAPPGQARWGPQTDYIGLARWGPQDGSHRKAWWGPEADDIALARWGAEDGSRLSC